ncbi:hypothetical protein [Paenibacillus wulumuqiensis]|uniref:hypothetical protein n=1 Tax=Paenibacillus wulumuqiensis TaxID=1567107 RepID=UPI00061909F0|nr:hypothetical protein [Paenibacillus wulumuqiensis]
MRLTMDYIRGYLQGVAQLNMMDNCALDYDLDEIPAIGTLVESVCGYMQLTPDRVSLDRLQDWQEHLLQVLPGWLYYRWRSADVGQQGAVPFDQEHGSRHFIHILKEGMAQQGNVVTVFRVTSTPDSFYELEWDDYLFFTNGKLYLLHFGMSD